jgi:hypothetical protein
MRTKPVLTEKPWDLPIHYDPHKDPLIDIPFRPGDLVIVSTGRKMKLGHLDTDAALEKLTQALKDHIRRMSARSLDANGPLAALEKALRAKPAAKG